MFAIETDLGRFEGDTEREAKRKLKAAQKAQAERDAEANRKYHQARLRAEAQAFGILRRKVEEYAVGSGCIMPPGWTIMEVTEKSYGCRKFWDDVRHERGYQIEVDTEDRFVRVYPYDDITHCVTNGAGWCIAISIAKQDYEIFAIGAFEDSVVWEQVPSVTRDDFRQRRLV